MSFLVVLALSPRRRTEVFNDGVGAVGYRVVRWLRSTLRSSALMVVVVSVMASVPLALAAGARRTSTAPDRYLASRENPFDVIAHQEEGPSLDQEIAALPLATAVESVTFVFGGITPGGPDEALDGLVFAGDAQATGDRLVAGREPDPGRGGEFVASKGYAEENGLAIGDTVHLVTLTPEQVAEFGFGGAEPEGPTVDAVLVGLIDGPAVLDDPTGVAVFPRPLLDDARIASAGSAHAIDLADGTSVEELREQLDTIEGGELLRLELADVISPDTRRAVGTQALGLWVLTALAALVTTAVLGQLLVRHTRLATHETTTLASLGATRLQVAGETAARAGIIAVAALALAAGVAVTASGIFPFGFVRRLEPAPGVDVDPLVLGGGAAVIALGIVGWVVLMTRRSRSSDRRPVAAASLAAKCPTTAMATGVRFALTSRDSASLVSRFGGVALMAIALVGTLTYAGSVHRLLTEPGRYGVNFDFMGDNGSDQVPPDQLALLETDPDVVGLTLYTASPTRVDGSGETLYLAGLERVRGDLDPPVLTGRLPDGPEEIALGRLSAERLDVSVGDVLTLSGPAAGVEYEVTGLIVPAGIGGNDLVGEGGLVTSAGYRRLDPDQVPHAFAILLRPGTSPETAERLLGAFGVTPDDVGPTRPPAIRNLARITYVPFVLAVLLAVLAVLLVMSGAHTAVRQRNHEVAVLRALGAERGWLLRVATWLAATSTLVPALIGVPLGFLAGRLAFRTYADSLGAVNGAATPAVIVVLGLAALAALAAVAAIVGGRAARRLVPARLLHAE